VLLYVSAEKTAARNAAIEAPVKAITFPLNAKPTAEVPALRPIIQKRAGTIAAAKKPIALSDRPQSAVGVWLPARSKASNTRLLRLWPFREWPAHQISSFKRCTNEALSAKRRREDS
jgi:hypothetical protein